MSRRAALRGLPGPSEPNRDEADAAAMRNKGYLVGSTQTFSLRVIGAPRRRANWYRVTFESASPERE